MLEAAFIIITILLAIIIIIGASVVAGRAYTDPKKRRSFIISTIVILTFWLSYVTILSLKRFFLVETAPGRLPVFLVAPAVLFIVFFFRNRRFRNIITAMPHSWVIYFQSFRIVIELLILGLFMEHMLPWAATFEGYNFDIIIGITAPVIGYLAKKDKLHRTTIRIWNMAGLFTLITVALILNSHAYYPYYKIIWHEPATILGKGFGLFPYTFLAGFFLPLGIFMHVFSLVKVSKAYRAVSPSVI